MALSVVKPEHDAYGQVIWNCHKGNSSYEIVEREDGFIDIGSALPYFREYKHWPAHEHWNRRDRDTWQSYKRAERLLARKHPPELIFRLE